MATLNELRHNILLKLSGGTLSDDFDIDKRQVDYWINSQRALMVRNELNKYRSIDPDLVQDLGCIELEKIDRAECCDINIECDILRTNVEIPSFIEMYNREAITRVGSLDKIAKPYTYIPYERAPYVGSGRFNLKQIYAFRKNKRIYIVFNAKNYKAKMLQYINVQGVLENPLDAITFINCDGTNCWTADSQYPIKQWMIPYMENIILKNELGGLAVPSDSANDSADTNTQQK